MATRRNRKTRKTRKNYKRTKKNYKRVRRGGGVCRDSVSNATKIDELNELREKYCGSLTKLGHKKCCRQIEEKIKKITNDENDNNLTKEMFKDLEERRKNKGIDESKGIEETKDVAGYESFGRESI